MYQVGLFATGRGQGSRDILQSIHEAIESGRLEAEIAFVFSNREPGEFAATDGFFRLVDDLGYPLVTRSFRKFRANLGDDPDWRVKYDREVMKHLAPYEPDLCLLAGYLLIFSEEMCDRYQTINLHPAAPGGPVGMWQKVIWELIETGADVSGNIMIEVIPEVDKGPLVSYCTFPIRGGEFDRDWEAVAGRSIEELKDGPGEDFPLFQRIRKAGVVRERPLVVETVRALAQGRVRLGDGVGELAQGLDLTAKIEASLRTTSAT